MNTYNEQAIAVEADRRAQAWKDFVACLNEAGLHSEGMPEGQEPNLADRFITALVHYAHAEFWRGWHTGMGAGRETGE